MPQNTFSYSGKNFLLLYCGWWFFWALVQTVVLHRLGLNWTLSVFDSLASNVLLGSLTLCSMIIYRFYQPGKENRMLRLAFAVGVTWLYTVSLNFILQKTLSHETAYLALVEKTLPLRAVSAFMFIAFFTILNWLWNSLLEQNELQLRRNETEKLAREAELMKLRQQLQPHFLFNSLNSISALATADPDEARRMIQQLSDFLRGTLRKDEEKTLDLKSELNHLELYLSIEKVRFGDRLNVDIKAFDLVLAAQIPPLILQPVVENAIKFGLYGTIGDVSITIEAQLKGKLLLITVKNPYDKDSSYRSSGTGFGLSSVERRLLLLYGRSDLLRTSQADGIFTCVIQIPQ